MPPKYKNTTKAERAEDPKVRHRNFAFTDYELEPAFWLELWTKGTFTYLLAGNEICPSTGKKHWQGCFSLPNAKTNSAMWKIIPNRRVRGCIGTIQQNETYCKKDKDVAFEMGEPGEQGKRTDLDAIKEMLDEGVKTIEIAEVDFTKWVMYGRRFDDYVKEKEVKRNWVTEVHYLWGESGTGKTRTAVEAGAKLLGYDGKFFGNYKGEDIVCFDDVGPYKWDREELLRICDRNEHEIRVIGAYRNWKPRVIYFTSNYKPEDCPPFNTKAMMRRYTSIRELHKSDCTEVV